MEDILVESEYSKEETISRLRRIFAHGNEYALELKVLHGEYYLSTEPLPSVPALSSSDSFFLQFRIKEINKEGTVQSIIVITPQSKAMALAFGTMFLSCMWLLIIASSIAEKSWPGSEIYLTGLGITLIMLLYFKLTRRTEKTVLERIAKEFRH